MIRTYTILIALFLTATLGDAAPEEQPLSKYSMAQLENQINAIDTELSQLANLSLRGGVGSMGYHAWGSKKERPLRIEIKWAKEVPVDQIVLAPILWRDGKKGFIADGFPAEFSIILGTDHDQKETRLGPFYANDGILPRIAPWKCEAGGINASWVRIEVNALTPRSLDGSLRFQLSEVLVFSGEENVALHQPVTVFPNKDQHLKPGSSWAKRFLTDGHMPYVMDAAQGGKSSAYLVTLQNPIFTIDLGHPTPLNRIHIHLMDQSDTIPMSFGADFAFPAHIIVEGANHSNFSDAVPLLDFRTQSIKELGPIMMWPIPETTCRYVRLRAPTRDDQRITIGFTEIELFSAGINVAKGIPFTTNQSPPHETKLRKVSALTDGLNFYGDLLPIRTWVNQLIRRHDLEQQRPQIAQELQQRYQRQKKYLARLIGLTALLIVGIGFTLLIDRLIRQQQIARIKERFAADLHDELGANLHSICLLSNMSEKTDSLTECKTLAERTRLIAERTETAMRHCTNMLEAKNLYIGLISDIQRAAERIATNLQHDILLEGEPWLELLKPQARVDLFLFYKECLVNICRHSDATELSTRLTADQRQLTLIITDNGCGQTAPPASLKRRARLLKAKLSLSTPDAGGSRITLQLQHRRRLKKPKGTPHGPTH